MRSHATDNYPHLFSDEEVTLIIYVLRWLTDTLPVEQQTTTYRRRKVEMERMLGNYRNRGARCL
jgi:hypothetical protein